MSDAQRTIGAYIRALREQRRMTQGNLAESAGISYQYPSGIETGRENFTIQVLEALALSLALPVGTLVSAAFESEGPLTAPMLVPDYFHPNVPLPPGLHWEHVRDSVNLTQSIIHRINRNLRAEVGVTLQDLIQANNFSGLVSNVLTNSVNECSPYKHNHDQRYPDLIRPGGGEEAGLEVKTTLRVGKGGESHNGHSGWHLVACYNFVEGGDIRFVHLQFANLRSHTLSNPDWKYVGSAVNENTGSRRTETYNTTGEGTTKLRDGSLYYDPAVVSARRWKQARTSAIPPWSIFAASTGPR